MKQKAYWMLALLCTVAQGVWAQTSVKSEQELKDAIADGASILHVSTRNSPTLIPASSFSRPATFCHTSSFFHRQTNKQSS